MLLYSYSKNQMLFIILAKICEIMLLANHESFCYDKLFYLHIGSYGYNLLHVFIINNL